MRITSRALCLTLGAILTTISAGLCVAAEDAATQAVPPVAVQQPAQELDVLDEIRVRGKRLSRVIEDAEDDLFKLYNKLNKDSDYDIFCGTMALARDSMIMVRKCAPGFIVYNSYSPLTNTVSFSSDYGQCAGVYPAIETNDTMSSYHNSCYSVGSSRTSRISNIPMSSRYNYFPAGPVLAERRQAYLRNVVNVVNSDPRLLEMVNDLRGLYDEMNSLQGRYVRARNADKLTRPIRQPARARSGPRAL